MPKIIRILSKDHVPWRYFLNTLPSIYETFILFFNREHKGTSLMEIFDFFLHPQIPDYHILTNHWTMEILFFSDDV